MSQHYAADTGSRANVWLILSAIVVVTLIAAWAMAPKGPAETACGDARDLQGQLLDDSIPAEIPDVYTRSFGAGGEITGHAGQVVAGARRGDIEQMRNGLAGLLAACAAEGF